MAHDQRLESIFAIISPHEKVEQLSVRLVAKRPSAEECPKLPNSSARLNAHHGFLSPRQRPFLLYCPAEGESSRESVKGNKKTTVAN